MIRFFVPILAGATARDRVAACAGSASGIFVTGLLSWLLLRNLGAWPWLAAPTGASAVLVFAVPSSPLAQPWAVVGGNTLSASVGLLVAHLVPVPSIAAGLSVGLAILGMSMLRCLHPPGGAVALTAALGGPAVAAAGPMFPLAPVAINAVLLVACGCLYHRLSRHSYPHRVLGVERLTPTQVYGLPQPEDVAAALEELGEAFDISTGDLTLLVDRAHVLAARRRSSTDGSSLGHGGR